jgi:hypothetical protein
MVRRMLDRRPLAFLTMDSHDGFVVYDQLAIPPLSQLGWEVRDVPWRTVNVDWNEFTAVVIRSPWDYHHHLTEFLAVLEAIEASTARLLNPLDIVRWNVDKTYLQELGLKGVSTVPTVWKLSPTHSDLVAASESFECDELVIKPTIGAGARDTFRWRRDFVDNETSRIIACYEERLAMIQPFVERIIEVGEWSLVFFDGKYSHTVLKKPKKGDFRVQEEFGSWLRAMEPLPAFLCLAEQAISVIPKPLAYARVDIVELEDGEPAIIELELIEPSLYFPYDDESPNRFARALDDFLHRPS